jgi:hypothetical protein
MSFSFSQPQTSSFLDPNELLNLQTLRDAPQVAADIHQNRLLAQQQAQQEISSHELEMGARLAGTIWAAGDTPEARAAAYPTYLAQARAMAPGYFKNAPATYPGDAATQALMRMGTPSEKLFQLGQASQDATGFANRWTAGRSTGGTCSSYWRQRRDDGAAGDKHPNCAAESC